MADNVLPIGTGETHTTITSWEEATDNDLVTATTREIGEMKNELFALTTTLAGATTDADYYRWLRAQSGSEFNHADLSGARVVLTGVSSTKLLGVSENYTRFGGSEGASSGSFGACLQTTTASDAFVIATDDYKNGVIFSQVVVYNSSSSGGVIVGMRTEATSQLLYNCLVFNLDASGGAGNAIGFYSPDDDTTWYNCVAYDINSANGNGIGFSNGTAYNCYGGDCTGGTPLAFDAGNTDDYCAADDTTPDGAHSDDSVAGGDCFVAVGVGSEDFHLKAGSSLIDQGNDGYSNEFDIDGSFAGTRNDIGIHEYVAAGATGKPTMRYWGGVPGMIGGTGRMGW